MISTCAFQLTFPGSNGDMPWVDSYCYVEDQVPAGCPVHIVTNDMPDPAGVAIQRWHGYNDPIVVIPTTTTVLGTMTEHVGTSYSPCNCEVSIDTNLSFHMYEVSAALNAGDSFDVIYTGSGGGRASGGTSPPVVAAGSCPAPLWPATFVAQCGCGGDAVLPVDPAPSPHPGGGCSATGEPTFALAGVALLAFARRRRRE